MNTSITIITNESQTLVSAETTKENFTPNDSYNYHQYQYYHPLFKLTNIPSGYIILLHQKMINLQPSLIGKLIKLRPLMAQDLEPLHKIASDKLIWQQHPEPQRVQYQYFKDNYFKQALQCQASLVFENHSNEIKGCSRYYNYRPAHRDIAIGYSFLSRDCWGSNINKQIKYLMMSHIYNWVDIVYLIVEANNLRSRKAVQKLGCRLLTEHQKTQKDITLKPTKVIFQITKENFNRSTYFSNIN